MHNSDIFWTLPTVIYAIHRFNFKVELKMAKLPALMLLVLVLPPWMAFTYRAWPSMKGIDSASHKSA